MKTSLLTRRMVLAAPVALVRGANSEVRREVFIRSPGHGTAVMGYAFYTRPAGGEMISLEVRLSRSDTVDVAFFRHSSDYGRTWSEPSELRTGEKRPGGMLRKGPRAGYVAGDGRFVDFWNEALLPSDNPLEGLRNWNIYYRVSRDGGRTFGERRQVIHKGGEFDARHPLPGVWTGKNSVGIGDVACVPLGAPGGRILLPVQITPLGPGGELFNPGGGYTYTDAAVLIGTWRGDTIEWEMSDLVRGDPARSTRGMDEGTLAFLSDGRLLMVMRGSNDRHTEIPSYRWVSTSKDGGRRWTVPEPWTYDDGQRFFSPSACSQLVKHSSGRLFWLGNIVPENPKGNRPRYPFVIGEVDLATGLLRRSTVRAIDTLQPGEDPSLTLSNFYAREDRKTHEIAVHMTRLFTGSGPWSGDAFVYSIPV